MSPAVAVVSANGTTHPHGSVLEMVRSRTVDLFCTPQHGRVSVLVDRDGGYAVRTEESARVPCAPGRRR